LLPSGLLRAKIAPNVSRIFPILGFLDIAEAPQA
jgi:hypothetical protein